MKTFITILALFICLNNATAQVNAGGSSPVVTPPNIVWAKTFGGTKEDRVRSIEQTKDSGYIIAGSTNSNDGDITTVAHGATDYWIVKLKKTGNLEWAKTFGGTGDDIATDIHQTTDDGYIVAGFSNSKDGDVTHLHGDSSDYWILKLNKNGDTMWTKTLGGTGEDRARSIHQTKDGGYIVAGFSSSNDGNVSGNHGNYDYWIVKLKSNGGIDWRKTYGGSKGDSAFYIEQTFEGGYIVAGNTYSHDKNVKGGNHGDSSDYWVLKLNKTGDTVWTKTLGGTKNDEAYAIHQTKDSGYIVAGYANSRNGDVTVHSGEDSSNYWIVKLKKNGVVLWEKTYGGKRNDVAFDIQQTKDREYVVAGISSSRNGDVNRLHGDSSDYWILKLNKTGDTVWTKTLGGTGEDRARSIQQTKDGGYIVAGFTSSTNKDVKDNNGENDYWIVKLSSTNLTGISADDESSLIAINEKEPPGFQINVKPNPANDVANLFITGTPTGKIKIALSDMNGKVIWNTTTAGKSIVKLPFDKLTPGIYFVRSSDEKSEVTLKLVKQ